MIYPRPASRLRIEPKHVAAWPLAGVWCGGRRGLDAAMGGQGFGGNGPDPDWAPANQKRRRQRDDEWRKAHRKAA